MKTEVKKIVEGKFEVTCNIDEKVWLDAQEKAKKKAMSNVQLKGFRKGHVPPAMAEKYINQGEVFNDAVNIVLPEAFSKAMEENKINPFIRPQVNVDKLTRNELEIKFTVVEAPKLTLGNYKGIKLEKKVASVTDKEVDDAVKQTMESDAELIIKDGAAKLGDTVILDFEGFVDGKPFDGGKANNYELALGSGQFIPGFEDQLVGLKANDEKDVNVTFPEQYVENLKGKKATFKCKIHEVKEKKIPELNDENVKGLGLKDVSTVAELKEAKKKALLDRKNKEAEEAYYNSLVEKIANDSKVEIAKEIIAEETNANLENLRKQVTSNGMEFKQYLDIIGKKEEDLVKEIDKQSEKNIRMSLALNAVATAEKITITKEDIDAKFKFLADTYKMDVKKVEEILSKDMNSFVSNLRFEKVRARLIELNK